MQPETKQHICLTGGGTLGSVTPLLTLVEQDPQLDFFWIGTREGPEKEFVEAAGVPFFDIPAYRFRRFFTLKNIIELPKLFAAYQLALKILRRQRPRLIVTAGSFIGVPVCFAAKKLRIPILMFQLDVKVGLANKLIAPFASHIITHFTDHQFVFSSAPVTVCGIPSNNFSQEKKILEGQKPVLLVVGGGTGSLWLNSWVQHALPTLLSHARVVHIHGDIKRIPGKIAADDNYIDFVRCSRQEYAKFFVQADVIVCRAGMGTIIELCNEGKAAILVPMPHSHQLANANYVSKKTGLYVHHQQQGEESLTRACVELLTNKKRRAALGASLKIQGRPQAIKATMRIIKELVHGSI